MNRSFYNGISGSKTYMTGMDTIANNVANVNTAGFKGKRAEFATLFSQAMEASGTLPAASDVGLGSRVNATALDLTQGSLVASDNTFDLAIAGDGWFAIKNGTETHYTRNGQFSIGGNEYLATGGGYYIQGISGNIFRPDPENPGAYLASLVDGIPLSAESPAGDIFLPQRVRMPGEATSLASFKGNINPSVEQKNSKIPIPENDYTANIDPLSGTASFEGTVVPSDTLRYPKPGEVVYVTLENAIGKTIETHTVLDETLHWSLPDVDISSLDPENQGPLNLRVELMTKKDIPNEAHFQMPIFTTDGEKAFVDMQFDQRLDGISLGTEWNADVSILQFFETYDPDTVYDPEEFYVDETAGKVYRIVDRQNGIVRFNENGALVSNTIPTLDNGGTPMRLDLGTPYDPSIPNSGYDGLTTFAGFGTSGLSSKHNGYEAGDLRGYIVTEEGTVYANFTNGKSSAAARIPIYHFRNDQGLASEGDVYFSQTPNSGKPFFYTDASGNVVQGAVLHSYALESSNVQLATALTEMIVMQKAFDANAKSITTSDQMIQKAINMKK
ncbi:flagellar hook protein FlgE [Hydrogenimonas sp.]